MNNYYDICWDVNLWADQHGSTVIKKDISGRCKWDPANTEDVINIDGKLYRRIYTMEEKKFMTTMHTDEGNCVLGKYATIEGASEKLLSEAEELIQTEREREDGYFVTKVTFTVVKDAQDGEEKDIQDIALCVMKEEE